MTSWALQPGAGVWVKDETGNVSGSHKARHLMGVMLAPAVAESLGQADPAAPLAIASCGNAALAAAVVARAAAPSPAGLRAAQRGGGGHRATARARCGDRGLRAAAGTRSGDPTVRRLMEAIAEGAVPFTVQGNLNGLAIEGGATLGWELIDQLPDDASALDRLVIHVGGGAFASAAALAFEEAVRWASSSGCPSSTPSRRRAATRWRVPTSAC